MFVPSHVRRILAALLILAWLPALPAAAQAGQAKPAVTVVPMRMASPQPTEVWAVGRASGNKCIDVGNIAAAVMMDPGTVDVVMRGGERWRLSLAQQCQQLSYYGGIYYQPSQPGKFCAGKDRILSRAGGSCRVSKIAPMRKVPPRKR